MGREKLAIEANAHAAVVEAGETLLRERRPGEVAAQALEARSVAVVEGAVACTFTPPSSATVSLDEGTGRTGRTSVAVFCPGAAPSCCMSLAEAA